MFSPQKESVLQHNHTSKTSAYVNVIFMPFSARNLPCSSYMMVNV